jgi:hypothetical protein
MRRHVTFRSDISYYSSGIRLKEILWIGSAKRYTKKTRQAAMSSSLDPLGLPAAVSHAFVCKKLVWSPPPIGRRGMVYVRVVA